MIQAVQGNTSKLLILSNNDQNTQSLKTVLSKYFTFTSDNIFHLTTKYYQANIQILAQPWPNSTHINQTQPQSQIQVNESQKQDLLIMLMGQQESCSAEVYDFAITKYNPQNFILIVNTANKEGKWKGEEVIATQVNNFIEVVKEDLKSLTLNPPQREKSGLLADNFQEGSIFSLLELIETTQWSCIQRVQQPKKQKKQEQPTLTKQQQKPTPNSQLSKEQTKQQPPSQVQNQHEPTQQQLQQQMLSFQTMIHEMMAIKEVSKQPQGAADNQRKQKAEDLIMRLLKGNFM